MRKLDIAEVIYIIRKVKGIHDIYHVEMNIYSDCVEYISRHR